VPSLYGEPKRKLKRLSGGRRAGPACGRVPRAHCPPGVVGRLAVDSAPLPFADFLEAHPELLRRDLLSAHYSESLLFSERAPPRSWSRISRRCPRPSLSYARSYAELPVFSHSLPAGGSASLSSERRGRPGISAAAAVDTATVIAPMRNAVVKPDSAA
jgi:hypothetical protein